MALVAIGCADEKKESQNEVKKGLSFSSKTIEKRLDNCKPEQGECTFISMTFPVAENGTGESQNINKHIEHFLINTIDYQDEGGVEKPEELAVNFIKNYKETAQEFPEYELPWEATINGKVAYKDANLISLKFNTDIFTGGAHGYRSTRYMNFNAENGVILESKDLFTSEFMEYVEKDFRKKQKIAMAENINSTGMFFENDEFHLPINIGVTAESIILHYNAYEIAPYSAGNFIMTYPRTEIEEFLKLSKKPKA
ncbi:hypothetical protein GCM10011532_10810 [Christiangramia forsetii]|nr:hypothetical protein GCM10011532_10810 [Christiangramia forsetii]